MIKLRSHKAFKPVTVRVRHLLYADGTSFKSAKPPKGVPRKPVHRSGSPVTCHLLTAIRPLTYA
ncbi:hypothetical protein LC593_05335 [Nostoc sp. CHAB 5844]|nr:hypothetical protein [Nostoc sp. CHAB 5844]